MFIGVNPCPIKKSFQPKAAPNPSVSVHVGLWLIILSPASLEGTEAQSFGLIAEWEIKPRAFENNVYFFLGRSPPDHDLSLCDLCGSAVKSFSSVYVGVCPWLIILPAPLLSAPRSLLPALPHSMFDVGSSMFDVRLLTPLHAPCSLPFPIRCSMLEVRCSTFVF